MTIKHLQAISPIKIFFSIVLSLFSIFVFTQGSWFGLILLGIALKLGLKEGIEIELTGNRYRKLYSIFGINYGAWKPLPEIEYISLFKTKKKSRIRGISSDTTLDFVVFKVNLFYKSNKHIEAFVSEDKDDALKIAQHISLVLEKDIWDASQEEHMWL